MDNIITQLKTLIQSVTDVQVVYDYLPDQISSYPAVGIKEMNFKSTYLNLGNTRREWTFLIRVFVQIVEGSEQASQKEIRAIAQGIMDKLEHKDNVKLGGACDFTTLEEGESRFIDAPSRMCVFDILYKATTSFNRFS